MFQNHQPRTNNQPTKRKLGISKKQKQNLLPTQKQQNKNKNRNNNSANNSINISRSNPTNNLPEFETRSQLLNLYPKLFEESLKQALNDFYQHPTDSDKYHKLQQKIEDAYAYRFTPINVLDELQSTLAKTKLGQKLQESEFETSSQLAKLFTQVVDKPLKDALEDLLQHRNERDKYRELQQKIKDAYKTHLTPQPTLAKLQYTLAKTEVGKSLSLQNQPNSNDIVHDSNSTQKISSELSSMPAVESAFKQYVRLKNRGTFESLQKVVAQQLAQNKYARNSALRDLQSYLASDEIGIQMRQKRHNKPKGDRYLSPQGIKEVSTWIESVAEKIYQGNYEAARRQLIAGIPIPRTNPLQRVPQVVLLPTKYFSSKSYVAHIEKHKYYAELDQIKITNTTSENLKVLSNEEKIDLLLTTLEEYMHFYQYQSNTFLSPNTGLFKTSNDAVGDKSAQTKEEITGLSGDYDEIDVFSKWLDWGFNTLIQNSAHYTTDRGYIERDDYLDWRQP